MKKQDLVDRDKIARVLTEFVSVAEYGGTGIDSQLVRSHLMMSRHTQLWKDHPDFIDLAI